MSTAAEVAGTTLSATPETIPDPPHSKSQLDRNARYLSISAVLSAGLGLLYWMLAERHFPTAEVGRASVVVSTATMLGTLACLSLGGMYERFLSSSGRRARRLIAAGIGLIAITSLLAGAVFALLPTSSRLFGHSDERWLFPAVVLVFALFALTDQILVGLRDAGVVAVKNTGSAALKLVALPLAAVGSSHAVAIYGSWATLSALATLITLTWVWRRSVLPVLQRAPSLPRLSSLMGHHGAVFAMMVVSLVLPLYLPLVVLRIEGSTHAAYFGLAQVLTTGATLMLGAVHSSYVAEASHPETDTAGCTRRMLRLTSVLAVVCSLGLALAGPVMLHLVGPAYREHAQGHLVLMAVAILPMAVVGGYAVMARVRNRMTLIMAVQVLAVVMVTGLSPWAVRQWGLSGVGLTFLAVETLCAAIVLVPSVRMWRVLTGPATSDPPVGHAG